MDTRLDNPEVDGGVHVERNNGYLVVPTGTTRRNTSVMPSRTTIRDGIVTPAISDRTLR